MRNVVIAAAATVGLSSGSSVPAVTPYSCTVETFTTAGVQRCVDAVAGGPLGGTVTLPAGDYAFDATVIIRYPYTRIVGAGIQGTLITTRGLAFDAADAAVATSIEGVYIYGWQRGSSGIRMGDITESTIRDVRVAVDDVGLDLRVRDTLTVDKVTIFAAKPILLGGGAPVLDHVHFHDLYAVSLSDGAVITIDGDTRVQDLVFDGHQAWVGGGTGLYWGPASRDIGMSTRITMRGMRYEQSVGAGWTIYIDRSDYDHLAWVTLDGVTFARDAGGHCLRGVRGIDIRAPIWDGAPGYLWDCRAADVTPR